MKDISIYTYLYGLALLFAFVCGVLRYKQIDQASRIIAILTGVDFLCEIAAFYAARKYHNNYPVYTIHSIIEFGLVCLYFGLSIDIFIRKKIGYYIGGIGMVLGICDIIFIQGLKKMNSYFLVFEGLSIIGMALFAFLRLLLYHDQLRLYKYHHFWFATILMFFWSITFLNWSLYDYLNVKYKENIWIDNLLILVVNILTYSSISLVFILYPKMQKGDE